MNKEEYIKKYGEEIGLKKYRQYARTLENFQYKYGDEEGLFKYNNWKYNIKKTLSERTPEQKLAQIEKMLQTKKGKIYPKHKIDLDFFIKKYGEEEGKIKYDEYRKKLSIAGKNIPNISEKMKYRNSKQYYIDKYGEEEGNFKYKQWCKSQDHSSLSFFIKKYGEEKGKQKYLDVNLKKNMNRPKSYFSKISQKLFKDILANLPEKSDVDFATKNKEFSLYFKENNETKKYCYDFRYKNKIIEYNGDWFHRNPKYYDITLSENKEIRLRDEKKINLAKNRNYEVLIIWDLEYKLNPQEVLQKCLDFLINDFMVKDKK